MDDEDRIVKTVDLAAPPARVWRALTDHQEFGSWFRVKLDGPFRLGETVTGVVTYPGHEGCLWKARVTCMDPERRFAFSWPVQEADADVDLDDQPTTLVEFRLEEIEGGTRLTITESGFSKLADPHRLEVLRGNREGWAIQAKNIADHVAG